MEKIWLKNWPESMQKELVYPHGKIPVHEYLRINAKKDPNKTAIGFYGKEISYKELDESSDRFGNYLIRNGVKKGDRVGLYMGNCPQYIIAHFGTLKVGAVVSPINPLFKEMELKYQINDAKMSVIVTFDLYMPRIENIINELPTVKRVVYTNFNDYLPEEPITPLLDYMKITERSIEGPDNFIEILKNEDSIPPKVNIQMEEDIAVLEYTGGSTGLPKGAMLSHFSHLFKALCMGYVRELDKDSVEVTPMPYFHIAGMVCMVGIVIVGSTCICLTQFDPEVTLMLLDHYKATNIYTAVPMNVMMMKHPKFKKYDLSNLKLNITSSFVITLNEQIATQWYESTGGCLLVEAAYGLSETHTADTFMPRQMIKYESVGIPTFDTEIKILDLDDYTKEVPVGQQGEIAVKNPGCMKSYWNNKEATESTLVDGFILTGDIGKFDEDGYLYWLGRFKEMIKVSGFSVFPEEVESLINQHPDINESAVIPIKNNEKGEVVKAFVVLKPDMEGKITEEEIVSWARKNMAHHKAPVCIEFRKELPKTGVKLLRRVLRDEEKEKNKGHFATAEA
jgi:long-chain acyl-CoA synthetase